MDRYEESCTRPENRYDMKTTDGGMDANREVSVLIPVHHAETPAHLDSALSSIFDQTYSPTEVVVVRDDTTSTPKLNTVVEQWSKSNPKQLQTVSIDSEHTLGGALQTGLKQCSHDLVARMDSDDISRPDRLERQTAFLSAHPDIDVVGSYIAEFDIDSEQAHRVRPVPIDPAEVRCKSRLRCPMNHPSVLFRRSAVLAAGGYSDRSTVEDYDLWVRMLMNGSKLANIPEVLVNVRAGTELYERRGGLEYVFEEFKQQREFLNMGFINHRQFVLNLILRLPIRLIPTHLRSYIYSKFLRTEE